MAETKTAVIIGVGPSEGLGAYIAKAAAADGLHIIAAGRTAEVIEGVAEEIRQGGAQATAVATDATDEAAVGQLIAAAEAIGPIDLAVYNAGNNFAGDFMAMQAAYFETAWRVGCLGGFLFAQAALKPMLARGAGSLIFTGASASMRGRPNFAAFTDAKAGLRALAQSLAREFGPKGIHVGHVVVDGGIAGDKLLSRGLAWVEERGLDGLVGLDGIAQSYMFLHRQPRNAWTHELDLRTHKEVF